MLGEIDWVDSPKRISAVQRALQFCRVCTGVGNDATLYGELTGSLTGLAGGAASAASAAGAGGAAAAAAAAGNSVSPMIDQADRSACMICEWL